MIYDDDLKEYLTINEVLCVLNDLYKNDIELKDTMKRMVIEMMGGKINVSSQFGVGSIFMVAIPQKISKIARPEGENELSETSQLANSNFDLGKRRVLIVDDNNLNIKVAIKIERI